MEYNISVSDSHRLKNYPNIVLVDHLFVEIARTYLHEMGCLIYRDYSIFYQMGSETKLYSRPFPRLFCFKDNSSSIMLKLWLPAAPDNPLLVGIEADLAYFKMMVAKGM